MIRTPFNLVLGLTGSLSLSAWSQHANAQDVFMLEEIVVTAQKREENLQDVPIAVTVMTEAFIAENDMRTLEDFAGTVPGLVVTNATTGGQAPVSIRGIGSPSGGGTAFNDDPVGVYVNGMYIARSGVSVQDLVDIESIQVLRGPQGTLYGRNSTAGSILITTKKPTEEFEAELQASIAQFDEYRATAIVSGPITDKLLGRVALGYRDANGYAENIIDGSSASSNESRIARVSIEYLANDKLTVNFVGSYSDQNSVNATLSQAAVSALPGPFTNPVYGGNPFLQRDDFDEAMEDNEVSFDDPNFTDITANDAVLSVNWIFDDFMLDSISGFRTVETQSAQDSDSQPNAAIYSEATAALSLVNNRTHPEADQFTQELRLSSLSDSPLQWIAGIFYIHENIDFDINIFNDQGGPPIPLVPGPVVPPFTGFAGTDSSFSASETVDAYALFFDASYQLTDRLKITLGGRYSYESKDADIEQSVIRFDNNEVLAAFSFEGNDSFEDVSPRLVLDYSLTADILVYANFSQGFKSGGFNSFDATPAATYYPEENIDAYEFGLKGDFFDRRLRVNATAFFYDYNNLQLRQAVFTGGVSIRTVEASEVTGAELETTWAPENNWLFRANLSYLDGEIKKGVLNALPSDIGVIQVSAQQFAPPEVFPSEDVSGNRMTRAPQWQSYLYAERAFSISDKLLARIGLTYKYQDEVYFIETNQDTDTYLGDSWNEVDIRFSLANAHEQWEVAVFGQNILDNRHVTQTAPYSGFPVSAVNEPAKWGVQGSWRF